jgi:hypothetical protein
VHSHLCPCGTVFAHPDSMAGNLAAHTCPGCRHVLPVPWVRYKSWAASAKPILPGWRHS